MKHNSSEFFQNRACEYFPCHSGVDDSDFNCMFCYCPLYLLGRDCGGNYKYLPSGRKSCVACPLPHSAEGYAHIMKKYELIESRLRETEND